MMKKILFVLLCFSNLVGARLIGIDPKTWSPSPKKENETWVPVVAPVIDTCETCKMFVTGVDGYLAANQDNIKKYVADKCPTKTCDTLIDDEIKTVLDVFKDSASFCTGIGLCEKDEVFIFHKKVWFV